jgi:outer membrane protein assembly factor BamB
MGALMHRLLTISTLVAVSLVQVALAEENWPQWRGPLGTSVAADGEYPVKFSAEEGLGWKVKLPGAGMSTPAVWGEKIFVTCPIDGQDGVLCYDMSGNELWRHTFGEQRENKRPEISSGSNPSPVTDGEHVVAYYKSGTLACVDVNGQEKWKLNLQDKYGKDTLWWDLGTSPILAGGQAVVAVMQEGPSYLIAVDLKSGEVAWKQDRQYETERESDQAYTTPQVVQVDGKDVIVTWGADHLTGHDAATGKLLWESGGFNPDNRGMWRVIASATIDDRIAVVPYGRGEHLAGVRIGGEGDATKSNRVWDKEGAGIGADVTTPVVANGKVYLLSDGRRNSGRITCRDLKTGEELWSAELPRRRDTYYSSPVLAGDKLYCAHQRGTVFVGRVKDDGFELLAENEMGETIIATPVPIRGGLLIRGEEHLFWVKPVTGTQAGG